HSESANQTSLCSTPSSALAPAMRKFQALRICSRYCAETSRGDIFLRSSPPPQGKIGAVRSTPTWQSQDLAEEINRPGTSAPRERAREPRTKGSSSVHGRVRLPTGNSCPPGK